MSSSQRSIACAVLRGGTSRGVYFLADDLPRDGALRDRVLLAVVGGPDELQIDGIGGGHPLTNKAAAVSKSGRDDADLDYLFLQTVPREQRVSTEQNCGNILVGVGPFALERGLIRATSPRTEVRVHMVNTGSRCVLTLDTPGGKLAYGNDGTSVICDYLDVAGSTTGALLPTG
ncbi:MAG TPA: PrpF domain-containing protein, partial [Gammaproteobacteria bacterium]